ncbi:MAG: type pilus assembly protein PilC [Desulfonauticus sp.]|jgi:type IV pilus assembly protein PilC|nr:type pilus assembly protein PilC [Desulfonauticus sp.]
MPIFIYKAKNRAGRRVKGDFDAPNIDLALMALKNKGLTDIKIKPKPKDLFEGTFLEGKVTTRDMVIFSRQFATLINAGVPMLQALQVMCEQTQNNKLRRKLYQVRNEVEAGSSLYMALSKHKDVFDDLYLNMVQAGEAGGVLDEVLLRLAEYIEKAAKLKSRVKGALTYPAVVVTVAIAVVAVILIYVIPTFESMFADMGGALPLPTQLVINLSRFVKAKFMYMVGGVVGAYILFKFIYRTEKGKLFFDQVFLNLPIFGDLLRKVAVAKFSRTLSTMIRSGVPILEALDIVAKTSGNKVVEEGIMKAKSSISGGNTIAEPLDETGVFPSMVIHMISVGESTGSLDTMLEKIADFYDDEVDVAVETLTSLLEPVMIVFLGTVVGGLVVSMYLPIFKMGEVVG